MVAALSVVSKPHPGLTPLILLQLGSYSDLFIWKQQKKSNQLRWWSGGQHTAALWARPEQCARDYEHINMHTPPLFNNVAWSMVSNATLLQKSPKLPDQTGLLKNSITIELPFIQFHLTLLNRPYGCESAGGKTPDTGQPATAKFLHLWSIEECVTWVCVYVCADIGICAYAALCWCLLS